MVVAIVDESSHLLPLKTNIISGLNYPAAFGKNLRIIKIKLITVDGQKISCRLYMIQRY